jgi:hypothetical protein
VAPPIDGSDKALDWIQDRFPSPTRGILRADAPELVQLLSDLRDAKRDVDAAKDRFDVLKNNVCAVIADASGIEADGVGSVTWRKAADKAVTDWEAVGAGAGPDVIAAHTTVRTGTRRFLCNFPNGKE